MSKRLKFFLGHFTISLIIALVVLYLIFYVWYPKPLDLALGVGNLTFMLLAIDLVIGPLFGWLVYKTGKKSLKFDLAVVILLQMSALAYGFYTIAKGRPTWIVYDTAVFHIVRQSDIQSSHLHLAKGEYQKPSWLGPKIVALQDLNNVTSKHPTPELIIEMEHPMYYADLIGAKTNFQNMAYPLDALKRFNDEGKIKPILNKYPEANSWIGLVGLQQDMVVLLNKEKAEVIKIVDLRPWN
ncbi:TfpX/TfpZ family type IV pilin accessory protein [Acinetobacter indicus]|uniref:TfpX/TfpZ family type IV pilin accessory protein n=1 Tax=Acinetobacter indicus TaxID=756892 RepID=UPI00143FFCD1|nr:TfpX/TfpZ family type IV pilin accessory protein [Acinetobacter indicus]QIZ59331.1 type IV pilin accessory protein [Acinetobacter indicus]